MKRKMHREWLYTNPRGACIVSGRYHEAYALVSERWPIKRYLCEVRCPVLLIHGDRDEVVPFSHSKKLRGWRKHYKVGTSIHSMSCRF